MSKAWKPRSRLGATSGTWTRAGHPYGAPLSRSDSWNCIPVRTQTGTEYDFIEKKVVPIYETRIQERVRGDVRVKSSASGAYDASIPASTADHDYEVRVSVGDPDGHRARATVNAYRHAWEAWENPSATLGPTTGTVDDTAYGIGDRMDLTMSDPARAQGNGDGTRYLFFEAQGGLRSATVQASPRYVGTFDIWAPPEQGDRIRPVHRHGLHLGGL